jgi:hypothetical protein
MEPSGRNRWQPTATVSEWIDLESGNYRSDQNQADSRLVVRDQPALTLPTLTHWCSPELPQSGH